MVLQDEIRSGREAYEADAEHDSETMVRYAVGLTGSGGCGITSGIGYELLVCRSDGRADE